MVAVSCEGSDYYYKITVSTRSQGLNRVPIDGHLTHLSLKVLLAKDGDEQEVLAWTLESSSYIYSMYSMDTGVSGTRVIVGWGWIFIMTSIGYLWWTSKEQRNIAQRCARMNATNWLEVDNWDLGPWHQNNIKGERNVHSERVVPHHHNLNINSKSATLARGRKGGVLDQCFIEKWTKRQKHSQYWRTNYIKNEPTLSLICPSTKQNTKRNWIAIIEALKLQE